MNRRKFLNSAAALLPDVGQASELACDVLVVGGGVGGFAATLAACRNGVRVILTEETDWIGGQLTAQAVPPDEHPWIEDFGSTRAYRHYRTAVRNFYRRHYPLSESARSRVDLNPGNGDVSRLTHEPRVSVAVLESMLSSFVISGQLTTLLLHKPEAATIQADRVTSITMADLRAGTKKTISARYFVDATELGDLLPITKTEFVTGSESQSVTGELHARPAARPDNNQSFTYCFAMDFLGGEDHTIDRPAQYQFWRDYVPKLSPSWIGSLLNWTYCNPVTLAPRTAHFHPNPDPAIADLSLNLWTYRRIADRQNFAPGFYRSDIVLVNWPQNDYWLGDLVTADSRQRRDRMNAAKQLSLSLLYWMQTDAPRPDGKTGFRGLRLRKDIVGTEDGLAKSAYIRESRRIQAEFTVLEQHVGTDMRAETQRVTRDQAAAEIFPDSVGIGSYRIDLHPSSSGSNYVDISSLPFQIPLGALLPTRMENLLPAAKNIGTTHITNGCYRLHPVEWNIGEAIGCLVAFSMAKKTTPRAVRSSRTLLQEFQSALMRQGVELAWPKAKTHPL